MPRADQAAVGVDVAVGLVALQAAFFLLLGVGLALVRTVPGWPVWAALVWVGVELLRGVVPWGGFPWGSMSYATVDTPLAPAVALVGTSGTSVLVALSGTTLAYAALRVRTRPVASLAAVLAVGMAGAGFNLARQAYLAVAVPATHRARAMSTLGGTVRIGTFLGPFLGAAAQAPLGLDGAFAAAAAAMAVGALLCLRIRDLPVPASDPAAGEEPGPAGRETARATARAGARGG